MHRCNKQQFKCSSKKLIKVTAELAYLNGMLVTPVLLLSWCVIMPGWKRSAAI